MKLTKLVGYLPDTASTIEHPTAARLKKMLDGMAHTENTSVVLFDVTEGGTAVFGLADESGHEKVTAQFKAEPDVKVSETTEVAYERELNRLKQQKVDKTRATKAKTVAKQ